ncbi:unnamed protein product, partial [Sphacelaria rigidula]
MRTREQALRIFDAVVADGAVDAKLEKRSGVDAAVCDGRRKFIYLVPSVVAPEVAIVADVQVRNMRTRVQELERSVSRLTAEIKTGQPNEHALQRVIAAGSKKDKRAVVTAAGSIVRVDIESAHELRNVSGDRDQKYAADISRNMRSMKQFLRDETPPALLALLSSLCHLQVSRDDPDLLFPTGDEARSGRRGDSLHAPRTAGADDDDMSVARDGEAGLMGTASGSGGGTAQQENG